MAVGGIGHRDGRVTIGQQRLDVGGAVFEIEIRADRRLIPHEADIPVGHAVMFEPLGGLLDGLAVKPGDVQPVGDDADANPAR